MKHKKLKISLISAAVAILMLMASLTVYAYFTTRVYVYTADGKEVAHVGMNLQLLFDKLDKNTVAANTDLKIPSYNVVNASGAIIYSDGKTASNDNTNKGVWASPIAGTNQYLHYNDGVNDKTLYDPDAPWGSAQNPYVISEPRHLQNLSALQSVGYFDMLYIGDNYTSGNYNAGSASIPYFVICTKDGAPVSIDGTEINVPIKPIGSSEHPFIGVIGGAFVNGTATVIPDNTATTDKDEEKVSSASAIHNFKVQTNTNQIDVGLFGFIGFMGKEPTAEELAESMKNTSYVPQFEGVFSSIQNVLISDVSVTVSQPSLKESISELFMPFWDAFFGNSNGKVDDGEVLHRFTYTDKGSTEIPHETHHIGIFAGHVSYALMNNISVYYSDDNTYAIDLTATKLDKDNYYSASGILGMMYNMNCAIKNQFETDANGNTTTTIVGNCVVTMGTGTSNDEINTGGGTGTGGGALSGNGRGYVTAAEIFTDFNNVDVTKASNNELLWKYRLTSTSAWVTNVILVLEKNTTDANGNVTRTYTLADGKTVATINNNGASVTAGGNTWTNFLVRRSYKSNNSSSEDDMFKYFVYDGTADGKSVSDYEVMGNKYYGQTIWKYSAGGNGVWHYGIRVLKTGTRNAQGVLTYAYTLDDGTTAVNFDENNCQITDGTNVWKNFFFTEIVDGTNISYMFDPVTGANWPVSTFERKPMTLIEAKNEDDEMLCIQWMRERLIPFIQPNPEPTGLYYFYDGVFTFGLSSPEDTVRDTWENNETPTLYLGANNAEAWEVNPQRGNKALVSLLKPVTNNKELDLAIREGKQFYITAQPTTTDAYLMSLLTTNTTDNKPGSINGQALQLENTLREDLWQSYYGGVFHNLPTAPKTGAADRTMTVEVQNADGTLSSREVTLADLKTEAFWNDYIVLNVGRTSAELPLDQLKVKYNVAAKNANQNYYFRVEKQSNKEFPVGRPVDGKIAAYQSWEGYFYYEYERVQVDGEVQGYLNSYACKHTRFDFTFYYQGPGDVEPIELGKDSYLAQKTYENNFWNGTLTTLHEFSTAYADAVVTNYFTPMDQTSYGVTVYSGYVDSDSEIDISNQECYWYNPGLENPSWARTTSVPLINSKTGKFHGETQTALVKEDEVSHEVTSLSFTCYLHDILTGTYTDPNGDPIADIDSYKENNPTYVEVRVYPSYRFSDSAQNSYLQLLNQYTYTTWWGAERGDVYSIWSGNDGQYQALDLAKNHSLNGVLVFEENEDYCFIRYAMDTTAQYVSYNYDDGTKSASFSGVATQSAVANTKLYVYIIEGVIDMDFGVNTFIPKDIDADHTLSAGDVVLWPQMTLTQGGYNSNTGYKTTITPTTSNAINASKYVTPDPTYSIIPLVGKGGLNWGDENGYFLGANGAHGLDKKFQMADQSDFGPMINIGDIAIPIGGTNTMVAPVGSNGVKATIPKGCVAFRVNAGGTQTIRVIVAVPTTDFYLGESGFDLDQTMDYYIGVWQVEAAGDALLSNFDKADAVEKFELPRSYSFDFNDSPTKVEGTNSHVVVEYEGQEYRTYLNGDCFLVAYEFTVSAEGVYVIGSVHGDENSSSGKEVPMEIVHFSVSGTASAGRDGVTGNQLGAIDFVYDDTANTIVTIDRTGNVTGPNNTGNADTATEFYSNYYASHCLLYTNNEAMDVTKGMVWVRRYISVTNGAGTTILAYKVDEVGTDANGKPTTTKSVAFLGKQYAVNADRLLDRNASS